ncbi:MAG: peptidylprolyl isomerase [Gammaproteobacteria bacterium]|jgi:peptidyl-prolyl cis-trans isomerase SurA
MSKKVFRTSAKLVIIVFLLLCCSLVMTNVFAIGVASSLVPLDCIAAIVNNDVITESQLDHQIAITKNEIRQANMQLPPENVLRKQVLQQLIDQQLQLQLAESAGIGVSDAELNLGLQRIAKQRNISLHGLYQQVQKVGYTIKEFRQEVRNQIKIEKLQQRDIISRIKVTPQEVNDFLRTMQHSGQSVSREYHLCNILIPLADASSPAQIAKAKKQANNIIRQLKHGANFQKLAMAKSGGSKALQGGDLGWRKLAELPTVFADKVKTMKVGDVAGPIRASNGVHIIKLLDTRGSRSSQQVSKKEIEQMIFQRKVEEDLQQFINTLRSQVYVKRFPAAQGTAETKN